jgi:hypothetical protein
MAWHAGGAGPTICGDAVIIKNGRDTILLILQASSAIFASLCYMKTQTDVFGDLDHAVHDQPEIY